MRDVRVSFFGDSLVAGVGDPTGVGWTGRLVAAAFTAGTPVTAYNLGVRGETSSDVLARWQSELAPRLAEVTDSRVVFSFGINDATVEDGSPRTDPAVSAANLDGELADARARALPVMVVGPPAVNDDAQQDRVQRLSVAFRAVAARRQVPYVHVADALRATAAYRRELAAGDGAHPGSAGYSLIAELVMPTWLHWLSSRTPSGAS